ncbi:MAG: type I-C CRISPR-associated protein Cas8c/Csd1 [Phycisphaerae bacterium]
MTVLTKLGSYYDRLVRDPEVDIADYGYSRQKISFVVTLRPDGLLALFSDWRSDERGKPRPRLELVPGQSKPSGSGINPCFLWDQPQYMLGFKPDDPKPERTQQAFEAFRDSHLAAEKEIDDPHFSAVCRFLESWSPERCAEHAETLGEIAVAFGVFKIVGETGFVHHRPAVRRYSDAQISQCGGGDAVNAPSLISGEVQPIARLHEPKIKNVRGAQSSGAALVSFNLDAFESYGKSQSYNAPVGERDAFKYCTALNRLTGSEDRRVFLADTTVVFWSDQPVNADFDVGLAEFLGAYTAAEDEARTRRVQAFLNCVRRAADGEAIEDAGTPYYILGLAPNAARISIRFWMEGTVGALAKNLGNHVARLEIQPIPQNQRPLTVQAILDQTARERKEIQPLLGGALLRAILLSLPYPRSLLTGVIRRINAEGIVNYTRAAVLKAILVRNQANQENIVTLNKDHASPAYQMGRLFAALEKTQEDSSGGNLNKTIKDSYFSTASSNPVAAFPRLLRLHGHHLNKFDNRGMRTNREKLVQEICSRIDVFPAHLRIEHQGLFFIGYYHQRQDFFIRKSDKSIESESIINEENSNDE